MTKRKRLVKRQVRQMQMVGPPYRIRGPGHHLLRSARAAGAQAAEALAQVARAGGGNGKGQARDKAKKNSVLLMALKGRYTSTKTSFDGLLVMIKDPAQKQLWGWANSEVYLAAAEKSITDILEYLHIDDFANQFIGGVDQKEKNKEEEYEMKCGASHAGLSPLVRQMENRVDPTRDQQSVRVKIALSIK